MFRSFILLVVFVAVISKICELHGPTVKFHVIAHCVGGLAIHIALLGGHISATHIASLTCTNSSMFFKVTTLSKIKMRLPIIPVSTLNSVSKCEHVHTYLFLHKTYNSVFVTATKNSIGNAV